MLSLGVKHVKFVWIPFCWCIKTPLYDGHLSLIFIRNLTERQILSVHSFLLIAIQFDVFKRTISSYNIKWRNGIKIRTFCTTTNLHLYHAAYPLCFVWKQTNELDNLIRANSTNHKYKEFFDLLLQSLESFLFVFWIHFKMIPSFILKYSVKRSSRPGVFCEKGVLYYKETPRQAFFCEQCEIFKNVYERLLLPLWS